ncbi:flavonoid 3'-monooxygenase CYP75B137-like [Salvia hispanica]|uniref:flavonoid 3'-monooxygenase CYP75B137-like n=1 Tax=Salvia hispanica TaxID=49212 RepID=UPI002009202E|nr:flavonoid 3'-monooxygenase CYP75B137-like [Salvia hispanica]
MQIVTNLTFSDQIFNGKVALYAIPIIVTLIWYSWLLSRKRKHPLPPGPRGLPLVGSLPFLDPELHSHFAHLAASYGPIFSLKLGRTLSVVITSPAAAREVLKQHDVAFANRPVPAVVMSAEYGGRDIVFTPHGPEWRMLRKACVRDMLGHATLDAFYGYRRHEVRSIVAHLYGLKGAPVNVGEMMFSGVLNVITSMLWGGTVEVKVKGEFREVVGEITELLGKPNVSDFFPSLAWMDLQGLSKQYKKVSMKLEVLFDKIIQDQIMTINGGDLGKATNFLQVLLRLKEDGHTEIPLTMMHIRALLIDMVVGGTDTTSSTVEFAMAEMMKKPEVMHKAQQEVDAVVGKNRAVEESDTNKLPYLNAVMKEVLRLHPVLPLMVPHCPSKPCIVAGYNVPKGTRTFVNVWAIHRDPENWTNPNEFIPERFMNGEGDRFSNDFSYLPFGSGRRSCAGVAMAERVVMYALASLVHSFRWEVCEGETLDLSEKFGIVLKKKVPLVVVPLPRLSHHHLYE